MAAFCAAPAPERLEAARRAFEQAMLAWQHVQPITFGPIVEAARASAIQLFPDQRGAISRQLSKALAAQEPGLVAPGGLEGKSVALTGFPALEQILYDDERLPWAGASGADADYACALAAAIARNLAGLAAGVLDDWQRPDGFATRSSRPPPATMPISRPRTRAATCSRVCTPHCRARSC